MNYIQKKDFKQLSPKTLDSRLFGVFFAKISPSVIRLSNDKISIYSDLLAYRRR